MRLAIDISNNNGIVDLGYCHDAGVGVVGVKATEGVNFHDDFYYRNVSHARSWALAVGAYDFARPSANTGAQEAKTFIDEVEGGEPVDFLALDMEDDRVSPTAGLAGFALDWWEHVSNRFKVPIYLYTSYGYARAHDLSNSLEVADFRLWLASWSITKPTSIPGWARIGAWQFTDEGFTPGVGRVDQSIWYDTL
jgi:GH25 family lysozyme M1 (1,4-beta-N-acetylmuramidase)